MFRPVETKPLGHRDGKSASVRRLKLLDYGDVARTRVGDQPKEFWPRELRAALVLDVGRGDRQPALSRDGFDSGQSPAAFADN
jgi:hypothetical protein